jgi:hypothetical protein
VSDVPILLTVTDVAVYKGVTRGQAQRLCKSLKVRGWYCDPTKAPIALYDSIEAGVSCENGHVMPAYRRTCRVCRYEAKYAA